MLKEGRWAIELKRRIWIINGTAVRKVLVTLGEWGRLESITILTYYFLRKCYFFLGIRLLRLNVSLRLMINFNTVKHACGSVSVLSDLDGFGLNF